MNFDKESKARIFLKGEGGGDGRYEHDNIPKGIYAMERT